jgi:hypothetical protein
MISPSSPPDFCTLLVFPNALSIPGSTLCQQSVSAKRERCTQVETEDRHRSDLRIVVKTNYGK